jgi:hypothetical protein
MKMKSKAKKSDLEKRIKELENVSLRYKLLDILEKEKSLIKKVFGFARWFFKLKNYFLF